jgi:hypothetical protein
MNNKGKVYFQDGHLKSNYIKNILKKLKSYKNILPASLK